jgi:hypothetical protein
MHSATIVNVKIHSLLYGHRDFPACAVRLCQDLERVSLLRSVTTCLSSRRVLLCFGASVVACCWSVRSLVRVVVASLMVADDADAESGTEDQLCSSISDDAADGSTTTPPGIDIAKRGTTEDDEQMEASRPSPTLTSVRCTRLTADIQFVTTSTHSIVRLKPCIRNSRFRLTSPTFTNATSHSAVSSASAELQ